MLYELSAAKTVRRIKARELSAREVTEAALARIEAVNPAINAVVQRTDDEALATADAVDDAIARGDDPGPLAGAPVTIKVNVDQANYAMTNGLRMLADNVATKDNPVVANLKKAGAVIVGRTNTPAFSLRWFTRNSIHGATKNPRNPALTPGGSSGGASAAVAAGIGAIGHGSDIGGSIRYPAYACGIQGIRPTLGRVPAWNPSMPDRHIGGQLMAVSGPLTRTIEDLRLALHAMSARDPEDPWWTPAPHDLGPYPKRAALCLAPEGMETHPDVIATLMDAADRLRGAGWTVEDAESPPFRAPAMLQARLWLAEMRRSPIDLVEKEGDPDALHVYAEMKKLCPAPDMNDLLDALQERMVFLREWMAFFERYPLLICPQSAEPPFRDQRDVEPGEFERVIEAQLTQVGLPLMGLPGLNVAMGERGGAPMGAQLIAGRFREDIMLDAAAEIEARGAPVTVATP
ncbi:MAG: amidase family protein [Pseudomonadota bacterium]